jgi:asparagine synthase (glutamine-hydrolysing)
MCGITGFLDFKKNTDLEKLVNASKAIKHRGNDDSGLFFEENMAYNLGVANQRLAIIDLSEKGHQPMISPCGNYIIVFNGTIYNYKNLRETLQKLGVSFTTDCDTEVLLNAYIVWKNKLFDYLDGIYSFCIIDKKSSKLLLARDKIGVKPLFYYFKNGLFCFGSEIKAINKYISEKLIDKKSLANYLKFGYFIGNQTIFENILKLKPGEKIELAISSKSLETSKFWKIPKETKTNNNKDISENTHKLLKESILSRTVSDVPIGVLLSGGYDSTLTTAIIKKNSNEELKTFTVGFEDDHLDESKDAKKIADYLQTKHYSVILTNREAIETIKNLGHIYDEPMGDSGAIALYHACKLASTHVKVLLSSEGGDELFAGYSSYQFSLKWNKLFALLPKTKLLDKLHPKFSNLMQINDLTSFFINYNSFFNDDEVYALTGEIIDFKPIKNTKDQLNQLLDFDLVNYLPEDLLMKADRTNMFWGIENRDPFLGVELIEYASQISQNNKIQNGQLKSILKEITHQYIPKNLMERPKKGFSIPLEKWLRKDLKEFVYNQLYNSNIHNLLDIKQINQTVDNFYNGKKGYTRKIWILLSLKLWADVHLVDL